MRKWILLAFVTGFILGGVALFLALPVKAPLTVEEAPETPEEIPETHDNAQALDSEQVPPLTPQEDLGEPPAAIITDDDAGKPAPFAAPAEPPADHNPDAIEPDPNPDDGLQDMSNSGGRD